MTVITSVNNWDLMGTLTSMTDEELRDLTSEGRKYILQAVEETISNLEITLEVLEWVVNKEKDQIDITRKNIKECWEFKDRVLWIIRILWE